MEETRVLPAVCTRNTPLKRIQLHALLFYARWIERERAANRGTTSSENSLDVMYDNL